MGCVCSTSADDDESASPRSGSPTGRKSRKSAWMEEVESEKETATSKVMLGKMNQIAITFGSLGTALLKSDPSMAYDKRMSQNDPQPTVRDKITVARLSRAPKTA